MEKSKDTRVEYKDTSIKFKVKEWFKDNYDSKNLIIKSIIRLLYSIKNNLYTINRLCTDKEFRAIFYMKTFKSKQVHQITPLTAMNRYPVIFSACKDYLKDKENINILSYGCSTGEEVVTLREYFNNATIIGAEINSHSLEVCRSRNLDDKIKFIVSK